MDTEHVFQKVFAIVQMAGLALIATLDCVKTTVLLMADAQVVSVCAKMAGMALIAKPKLVVIRLPIARMAITAFV